MFIFCKGNLNPGPVAYIYTPPPPQLTLSVNIEKLVERKFFSVATNLKLSNTLALH